MESLEEAEWDIVLTGTGLSQSLLALYATARPYLTFNDGF